MIELPEALALSRQLAVLNGKTVVRVLPPTRPHKFCWWNGDPAGYAAQLVGRAVAGAEGFGSFVELAFDGRQQLCVNDGVNLRLLPAADAPRDYQLLIGFDDGTALVFTVAMYGGICLHAGEYDNDYYVKSRTYVSPFAPEFAELFRTAFASCKPTLSAKAFLATEQRFPGVGNGVLQDILFAAGVHPKRKLGTLDAAARERLLAYTVSVLREMTEHGGRDTERDLYGVPGGYATQMSRNGLAGGCPACGGVIVKEAYLGGSVYYCPRCQPLPDKEGR